jgi:hypothetical protein
MRTSDTPVCLCDLFKGHNLGANHASTATGGARGAQAFGDINSLSGWVSFLSHSTFASRVS